VSALRADYNNLDLARAFPESLRDDAIKLAATLPQPSYSSRTFSVLVGSETVFIPYRIYHDPGLIDLTKPTPIQTTLLDCLLTRHHDGFVREKHLTKILNLNDQWIPPFVVQLVGEYVIEIIQTIRNDLDKLDTQVYRSFLTSNPTFHALTKQRVMSYWDCYHRWQRSDDYAGFEVLRFFDGLARP
jgi:hypothetical protein